MKKFTRIIAVLLVVSMLAVVFAGCKSKKNNDTTATAGTQAPTTAAVTQGSNEPATPYTGGDTLVVGYNIFSKKFSPFFSKTAYDQDVAGMTQLGLLTSDREGNIILKGIEGETHAYNGKDYLYTGIADCVVTTKDSGEVEYAFTLKDGVKFSDGKELTVDDVLFSMYVLADPTYNGSSTFYTLPIKGMEDYRAGVEQLGNIIFKAGQTYAASTYYTEAEFNEYWAAYEPAGKLFAQDIVDYVMANYFASYATSAYGGKWGEAIGEKEGLKVAFGMAMWGFGSWDPAYEKAADGTSGLVGEKYKKLYAPVASEADAAFTAKVGEADKFFAAAKADSTELYYISATEEQGETTVYTVAAYTGDRYTATTQFTGAFTDSMNKTYDCTTTFPTIDDYWANIKAAYDADEDGKISPAEYTTIENEAAEKTLQDCLTEATNEKFTKGITTGNSAANISGIVKTGANTFTVTMTEFDAVAIYQLGVSVAPAHYYGDSEVDVANNKFGFTKGDLACVKAKTENPMGAGAYKFVDFKDGVVTFERNTYYYKGTPKITYIKFQEVTSEADKVSGLKTGTIDISDPTSSDSIIDAIKEANSNKQLTGDVITYNAVDNLGYGYIGINADAVKIGEAADSAASKNLRKGIATLFSVYRDVVINSYYGDRAAVIQYPISNTSWAAPKPADEGYAKSYSKTVDGAPIYTDGMTTEQEYAAAKEAAIGFFKAAGYVYDEAAKKFTAAPAGGKLDFSAIIPADGIGDHPSYRILTSAKEVLESIGFTFNIVDPTDSNVLWNALDAGTCEIWAAAWGSTVDPDMYQVYHSSNVVGVEGSSESNHYRIKDAQLDQLIMDARKSPDNTYRKTVYKQCLDIILDWGVEIPTYQRQNMLVFSTSRINLATMTPDITTYWGWANDLENLEMK